MKATKFLLIMLSSMLLLSGCANPEQDYNAGVDAMEQENWDEAIKYFTDNNFEDSAELLKKCEKEKGMHENADYKFLEDLGVGLMKRYEISLMYDDTDKCISTELMMINKYENETFYDKDLQQYYLDYIDALNTQKESLSLPPGDQRLKYLEGNSKRAVILKDLTDKYGFLEDNLDYLTNYYNETDKQVLEYEAYKKIEEDLSTQLVDEPNFSFVNDYTARFVITNNTEYTYDLELNNSYYDDSEVVIETLSYYYERIEPGKTYNLDFDWPIYTDGFNFYTESYIIL